MKKRKITYSMTAKQRKESNKKPVEVVLTEEEIAAIEQKKAQKAEKKLKFKRIAFISVACLLAVCLIITAIALPFILPENIEGNPIAVIKLKDGSKIEVELYKDDAPGAVANFIYLSLNDFYDNTMIHDITNGFVSFGGYTSPTEHRSKDKDFVGTLGGFSAHTVNEATKSNFKLGYRLKRENTTASINQKGLMVFMAGTGTWGTSTHFMFTADTSPQLSFPGSSTSFSSYTVMGNYANDASLAVIERIYAMEKSDRPSVNCFRYPQLYQSVLIKNIEIKNISRKYKRNLLKNFEQYITSDISQLSSWTSTSHSYSSVAI